jgi:hypothetical protein
MVLKNIMVINYVDVQRSGGQTGKQLMLRNGARYKCFVLIPKMSDRTDNALCVFIDSSYWSIILHHGIVTTAASAATSGARLGGHANPALLKRAAAGVGGLFGRMWGGVPAVTSSGGHSRSEEVCRMVGHGGR